MGRTELTFTIDADLSDKLLRAAARSDETVSEWISAAVRNRLDGRASRQPGRQSGRQPGDSTHEESDDEPADDVDFEDIAYAFTFDEDLAITRRDPQPLRTWYPR